MTQQLELFDDKVPMLHIRCPGCGFCPAETVKPSLNLGVDDSPPEAIDEQLDEFEVGGCDDGQIMCPECAFQFSVNT